jgi:citrate synthase
MRINYRVQKFLDQLKSNEINSLETKEKTFLTINDSRTGKKYEIAINNGTINGQDLNKIKASGELVGLRCYDPGYKNTASAKSKITWIDGPNGILNYRGYPIEQLAKKSTFLEVSYLLIYGELPTTQQLNYFSDRVMKHTFVHEDLARLMQNFRYDAHPMGMLASSVCAMGTFQSDANPALQGENVYEDLTFRNKQIHRLIGCMPTLAAFSYRHRMGKPYVLPPTHLNLTYSETFLYMMDKLTNSNYYPNKKLAEVLDTLFILHADHELNCSTSAMRHLSSSGVDVYTSIAGSIGALYGPRHGGANEAVLRMLQNIGSKENIPAFIEKVKKREIRLMGFGHRVYKNYDPRARIVRKLSKQAFDILGREPLIEIAEALEETALNDPFFKKRKLYPNVDFYSGLIYKAYGFPTDFFTVLFAIPRTAGWLAHWYEFLDDKEQPIVRPQQIYQGEERRDYVFIAQRQAYDIEIQSSSSASFRRAYSSPVSP